MEPQRRLIAIANYTISPLTLGEGSFSKVKVARHRVLQKDVALKIIKQSSIKDPYVAKNLEREAKILSGLYHNNVVRLFEVAHSEGYYCLAMEHCTGGSVCEVVQYNGKLPESRARLYFQQLIQGLRYIHYKVIYLCQGNIST